MSSQVCEFCYNYEIKYKENDEEDRWWQVATHYRKHLNAIIWNIIPTK